jgi:biopolymer transport protein TolR
LSPGPGRPPESRAGADPNAKPVQIALDKTADLHRRCRGPEALPQQLAAIAAPAPPEGRRIYVRADRTLDYGRVLHVMGEFNRAD